MYCCFVGNNAVDAGGGMYNYNESSPALIGNSFCNNSAKWGAGLANFASSSPQVTNCVFSNNDANQTGGGISNTVISDPEIVNCTFYGNRAGRFGGAVYSNGSDPDIYNSIFWANSGGAQIALIANNRRTHIGYCDIEGGKFSVYLLNATVVWDGPIMSEDPNFVDPNSCNLRLRTTSRCLDASNNLIAGTIEKDRDGEPRFMESAAANPPYGFGVGTDPIADLGAYERPQVIYVNSSASGAGSGIDWHNAYVFLQDALAEAQSGAQIWVAKGKYTPDRFTDYPNLRFHPEQAFNLNRGVTLLGGFNAKETDITDRDSDPRNNETVLSGDLFENDDYNDPFGPEFFENSWTILRSHFCHSDPNVICDNNDANAILDGFTIKGGYANGTSELSEPWNKGGGMYNYQGSPSIKRCLFEYNWAYDQGGGMYNYYGSPTLTDCEFSNNYARQQGAGLCNEMGNSTLIGCDFKMNKGAKHGGGVYNEYSFATLVKCSFSQNGSTHEDGGAMTSVYSDLCLYDCEFTENQADSDGGAMCNLACMKVQLFQCSFENNKAGDDGGAIYSFYCWDVNIVNCAFIDNNAPTGWGGAINSDTCIRTELINSTLTRNKADEGGGIYSGYYDFRPPIYNTGWMIYSSILAINNSILWDDTAPYGPEISLEESELYINDSIIKGGEPNIFVWGDVSIDVNNLYVDDPLIEADGRLVDSNSPARDAGNNSYLPACVTTDLAGNPRIYNDRVDLGAYEFGYSPKADFDNDGFVGFHDFAILGLAWMTEPADAGWDPRCDITADNRINWRDLEIFCDSWRCAK
jgi:hypothetical protein